MKFKEVTLLSEGHMGNAYRTLKQLKFNKGNLKGQKTQISPIHVSICAHTHQSLNQNTQSKN